jgi:hypothetical protein
MNNFLEITANSIIESIEDDFINSYFSEDIRVEDPFQIIIKDYSQKCKLAVFEENLENILKYHEMIKDVKNEMYKTIYENMENTWKLLFQQKVLLCSPMFTILNPYFHKEVNNISETSNNTKKHIYNF